MLSSFNPTEQLSLFWSLSRLLNHALNDFIPFPCKNIEKPAVRGIILSCLYLELCPAIGFQESPLIQNKYEKLEVEAVRQYCNA